MSETVRINKAIAAAGVCSRRKADELIASGVVAVNGTIIREPGIQIDPEHDKITVRGTLLEQSSQAGKAAYTYIMMHKPVQVVSTVSDPQGRQTVLSLLPPSLKHVRVYPVGRLDYFSEGLLLLTDDGNLTHRLTHPGFHVPREYEVVTRELPNESQMNTMRSGMVLAEGEHLAPVEVELVCTRPPTIHLTLHQGVNRQIRRMCRDLGLTILTLKRYKMGPLSLGLLPKRGTRPLSSQEVEALYQAVGLSPSSRR